MDDKNYSKRRLFSSLSWLVIGIYVVLNAGVFVSGVPIAALIIILPIINVVLILIWFFVRTYFNQANDPIKHGQYLNSKAIEAPLPKYGKKNGSVYVPNLKVSTELFDSISTNPNNKTSFDITMKDYLKLGRPIIFHDEIDYGMTKRVQVSKVTILDEKNIEVSFSQLN